MLIMGNQTDLGGLRRVQQNDEVFVYDRQGNAFIYRFVAFSADGQTEREIDPNSIEDAWVFAPTQDAILTIIVNYPQPLPPVDPNPSSSDNLNQVQVKDDYLTWKKLAYRAVLAMYAPAAITPAGTPVAVPDSVWRTVPAPTLTQAPTTATNTNIPITTQAGTGLPFANKTQESTSTPAMTPTPGPLTPVIPTGLPHTGYGGGQGKAKSCQ
jgi:hypothetical protein